ncbi:MAG: glycosyltransferase [Candidatus Roizmanbacteria bacterium]|nr:glycosyltransferase [Candidatus Roizmanbacteria bacterium]
MKKAIIVIPTYNERGNIKPLIDSIITTTSNIPNWEIGILVVDSSSPDGTLIEVKELQSKYPNVHIIETKKEGLGKAYISGFTYAIEHLNPYVLFEMDADLSHNPKYIPSFLQKIEKGADFVIGSRYIKGGSIPSNWGFHRKLFSVCANLFVRLGFMRLSTSDWTGGFRAIKVWVVKSALTHVSSYSGYVFQVALLDFATNKKAAISEVPIQFIDRTAGESKINSIQYIIQTFLYVLTHSSFIKFVITGFIGFGIDFTFAYLFISFFHIVKTTANMLSAEVAIISNFFINNFWSFRHKKIEGGVFGYVKKFILFNVVSSGSIVIQGGGLALLLHFFGDRLISLGFISIPSWIIYKILIIACVIIPYSYILYNKVIWKK